MTFKPNNNILIKALYDNVFDKRELFDELNKELYDFMFYKHFNPLYERIEEYMEEVGINDLFRKNKIK